MKRTYALALTLGLVAVPGLAFAQSPQINETPTPGSYAPDSYDAPIHGTHDKGAAVRENQRASHILNKEHGRGYRDN